MEKKRTRYNWKKLKAEFLSSKFQTVQEWRKAKDKHGRGKIDGNFNKHTKGRTEEKQRLQSQALEKAKEKILEDTIQAYKPSQAELSEMHAQIIQLIRDTLQSMMEYGARPQDLQKLREMIKVEKGEPTKYIQQDTTASIKQKTGPTQEEMEKIQSLLSQ